MVGGVLSNNIDNPGSRPLEVMQVRKRVGQSRTEMEKRRGGFTRHPVIAIRSASCYSLVQTKNATHAIDLVEGCHKMHFRRARVGEADFYSTSHKGSNEAFRAVHFLRRDFLHFSGEKDVGTRMRFSRPESSGIEASTYALQPGAEESLSRRCSRSAIF